MSKQSEHRAELLLLVPCVAEGLFPIIANTSASIFPPIFFLSVSMLLAAVCMTLMLVFTGEVRRGVPRIVYLYAATVGLFITTSFALIFLGTRYTSGINTALLLQAEILFTFLFATFILGERLLRLQLLGAVLILAGTGSILYNGSITLNSGDLLIVTATTLFPVANTYAKKALQLATPLQVLTLRYLFGGVVFFTLSLLLEDLTPLTGRQVLDSWWLMFAYVGIVLILSKVFWYRALRDLPLGKAIYIVLSYPVFSLIFAFLLLGEVPTAYQIVGFLVTMSGVFLLVKRYQ